MDAERYATGQTFDEFLATAVKYAELWHIGARRAQVTADAVAELATLESILHFVILNEDWCLDAVGSVPYIVKLASMMPHADVRIFRRDTNPDLIDSHLSAGSRSIPVTIVYDAEWRECGWWGPRPEPLQAWVKSVGVTLEKADKYHQMRAWYARDHGDTTAREIAALVRGCAVRRESSTEQLSEGAA